MKSKKVIATLLASTMMLALAGCKGSDAFKAKSNALIDAAKEHGAEKLVSNKDIDEYDNGGYDTSSSKEDMKVVQNILSDVSSIDVDDIEVATIFMDYEDGNNYIQGVICDFSKPSIAEDFYGDAVDTIEDMIDGVDQFITDADDDTYYIAFSFSGMEIYYVISYEDTALTYVEMIGTDSSFTRDAKEFFEDFTDKAGFDNPIDLI